MTSLEDIDTNATAPQNGLPLSLQTNLLETSNISDSENGFSGPEITCAEESDTGSMQSYSTNELSDYDSSSSDITSSSDSSYSTHSSDEDDEPVETFAKPTGLSEQEKQALTILSVFLKHNLSASASKDIMLMMKQLFPDSEALNDLSYEMLWKICGETEFKEIHYCSFCNKVFPENLQEYKCSTPGCNGLRFEGPEANQSLHTKLPRKSFIMADVEKQLASLIKVSGKYSCGLRFAKSV